MMCKFKIKIADQSKRLPFFGNLYSLYPFFSFAGAEKSEKSSAFRFLRPFAGKSLKIMLLSCFTGDCSLKRM